MFSIYADGRLLNRADEEDMILISPKLTLEMGRSGSLEFSMPPGHLYYGKLRQLKTAVTVKMDGNELFRGRVLSIERDFNNFRKIYCEGDLSYLVDSVQKGEKYKGTTHELFRRIIAAHNARMEPEKRFAVGQIGIENREIALTGQSEDTEDPETGGFDYEQIAVNSIADEWKTTYDYIEACLIEPCGGYLRTRRVGEQTYLDLITDYGRTAGQEIAFGKNLLDLTEEITAEELFTVLIPLGDENLTIESVNNGSDELVDEEAAALYGRIVKTQVFENVSKPETLLENGRRFLSLHANVPATLTVKAIDLSLTGGESGDIRVGDKASVQSKPHGLAQSLTCTRIEYDLINWENTAYTFGTPRQSLTERYREDRIKTRDHSAKGGGGAGKAAEEKAREKLDEFYDAWINVDPEAGPIDLGTLYQKFNDGVKILESTCGISLDSSASQSNVNIKALRAEFDEQGNKIAEQGARIDVLASETESKIELTAAFSKEVEGKVNAHYAEFKVFANETESAIEAKADRIEMQAINMNLNAVTTWKEGAQDQIDEARATMSAVSKRVDEADQEIAHNAATITTVANKLESRVSLVAESTDSLGTRVGSLEIIADKQGSQINAQANKINLKADEATLNAKVTTINNKIKIVEDNIEGVRKLIADEIQALKADISWLNSRIVTVKNLNAEYLYASHYINSPSIRMNNYTVATQKWVNDRNKWGDAGDGKRWLMIGGTNVYVALGNHTHDGYATQSWVESKLAALTLAWSKITGKPSYFPAKSHRHVFKIDESLANGHTHRVTVAGNSYTTGGVSTNASHKISITGYTNYTGG